MNILRMSLKAALSSVILVIFYACSATAAVDFSIRLVDGKDNSSGRVEVSRDNTTWGTVCDDFWNDVNANVLCRQLGYRWGKGHQLAKFGQGTGLIFLDNVLCKGTENKLSDCAMNPWGKNDCSHKEDASVSCFSSSVRAVSQGGVSSGTVEVLTPTGWVQVCDDGWDDNDAHVMCKQMGFMSGMALKQSALGVTKVSSTSRTMTNFGCNGNEEGILNCTYQNRTTRCLLSSQASVICYDTIRSQVNNTFEIRLRSNSDNWGEVEVRRNGLWGQICKKNFSNVEASVVCKRFGFKGGLAFGNTPNSGGKPVWISELNCTGSETNLTDCTIPTWGTPIAECRTAHVLCYKKSVSIDIVGGSAPSYGRVEITYDGVAGTVCDNGWSPFDADVLCKQKGYTDGQGFRGSYYGPGTGPVWMDGMGCRLQEESILECPNSGWNSTTDKDCAGHTKDAGVFCYKSVRFSNGDHSNGIVDVYNGRFFVPLCGIGFTNETAQVICRELGFNYSQNLSPGLYGSKYGRYSSNVYSCVGNETTLKDCPFSTTASCSYFDSYKYANIACRNEPNGTDVAIQLKDGSSDMTGRVAIKKYGVWGRVCSDFWDDNDATVACRQTGHMGGVAYRHNFAGNGPYFYNELRCRGNETRLEDCVTGTAKCQYTVDSGVLCYNSRAPKLKLSGGSKTHGRVDIQIDNEVGTICTYSIRTDVAGVLCRQMGFADGEILKNVTAGFGPVFMAKMSCGSTDKSIFHCSNAGWKKNIPPECETHNYDAGVTCYSQVRINKGHRTEGAVTGIVEMYISGLWASVCYDDFDDADANVVCQEMGYSSGTKGSPGQYGVIYYPRTITAMNCTGRENSLMNCSFNTRSLCPRAWANYATVLCVNTNAVKNAQYTLEKMYFGRVQVLQYGIQGYICNDGWDDNSAKVMCKQQGFAGGVVLGASHDYTYTPEPFWISEVKCNGKESKLTDCSLNDKGATCKREASVLCYKQGLKIRLAGGKNNSQGRVELNYDGTWGSVCDYQFDTEEARVVCQQMGFIDGHAFKNSYFGNGTGPVYVTDLACTGNETTLLSCPNAGWNSSYELCAGHSHDAAVSCYGELSLRPGSNYGAIQVFRNGDYRLVCDEGFDNMAAKVVCRELGYGYGVKVEGSAFGKLGLPIHYMRVSCTGNEMTLLNCSYKTSRTYCTKMNYASVVCTNNKPTGGFDVQLKNVYKGPVQVDYFDTWGYLCPEGFDDKEAMVICKQKGYKGGFAYRYKSIRKTITTDLRWLSNIECNGTEKSLRACPNMKWGMVSNCSYHVNAAAYCYNTPGIEYRLANGTKSAGRIEIQIDGTWGRLCDSGWGDLDASVFCQMMNFTSGKAQYKGEFGSGTGPMYYGGFSCLGNESSIFDCPTEHGDSYYCTNHGQDAAVACFKEVKTSGPPLINYGRLDVLYKGEWQAVCDSGFINSDAKLACQYLGYVDGKKQCCSAVGDNNKIYPYLNISLTNTHCQAGVTNFMDCTFFPGNCLSKNYVTIYCSMAEMIDTVPLKLRIKSDRYYGALEGNRYGFWGPVCNADWDDSDATVACRENGYIGGMSLYSNTFTVEPYVAGRFKCNGTEKTLDQCPHQPLGDRVGCQYSRSSWPRAAVLCYNNIDGVQFRLADGTSPERGRVEILYNGKWGTVCNSDWDNKDARVFCKQLGYLDGEASNAYTSSNTAATIYMGTMKCTGSEKSILVCKNTWYGEKPYCRATPRDAGVICHKSVQINQGDGRTNGIINVNMGRSWLSVCNEGWDNRDARVACRELGFQDGLAVCCGTYGYNFRRAGINKVNCTGNEAHLLDCPYETPTTTCYSRNYSAVACFNGTQSDDYTLSIDSASNYSGVVQLTYMNVSGRICTDGWNDKSAAVVCKQLGFPMGQAYYHYRSNYAITNKHGPYWTSKVNCTGNEVSLAQCSRTPFGQVAKCDSLNYAGVICYNKDRLFYRIAGATDFYGRVEISVDGVWGSLCRNYWDARDAHVLCKQLGFATGEATFESFPGGEGPVWEGNLRCDRSDSSLDKCSHEGWRQVQSFSSCANHKRDAGVFCYSSVRLSSGTGQLHRHGAVLVYRENSWWRVCDQDFDDTTARQVCHDLGYIEGKAICCSAYGETSAKLLTNYTMQCKGGEDNAGLCLKQKTCETSNFASVVCFRENDTVTEDYSFLLEAKTPDANKGLILVKHYGIEGRICPSFWDDANARVFCKSRGHQEGIAYQYSMLGTFSSDSKRGPYWVSAMNCTGNEATLEDCEFNTRMTLGNCSGSHLAGVLCYNDTGIEYRLSGGGTNYGRVEINIGGEWGTICDEYWDNKDARVMCRNLGFSDGEAFPNAKYGQGSGPIWLSHIQCNGTEVDLHHCPHRGFENQVSEGASVVVSPIFPFPIGMPCTKHTDDASVFCYGNTRLNQGTNATMGGVEVFYKGEWNGICDAKFEDVDAAVVCKHLGFGYGKAIPNSSFGKLSGNITIYDVSCDGTEDGVLKCKYTYGKNRCLTKTYASVYCSNQPFTQEGLKIQLSKDSFASMYHGILEVKVDGIWGRVCYNNWTDLNAQVACKQMNYKGGYAYLHIMKNTKPIVMRNVNCTGTELSLQTCKYDKWSDSDSCSFDGNDAGVVCYNKSGIEYRLAGGSSRSSGRIEMKFDGIWGTLCNYQFDTRDARVACKQFGFHDGMPHHITPGTGPIWINAFFCSGSETSLLKCMSTGFNSTFMNSSCAGHKSDAGVDCYNETMRITKIRLKNSVNAKNYGRLEVYVTQVNQWGTVCDDSFDNIDATVVCKQLGFLGGKARNASAFGSGTGPIWLDNVACFGNESRISECPHRGIGVENCLHREDVGVECYSSPQKTTSTQTSKLTTKSSSGTFITKTTPLPTKKTTTPSTRKQTTPSTTSSSTTSSTAQKTTSRSTGGTSLSPVAGSSTSSPRVTIIAAVLAVVVVLVAVGITGFICYRKRHGGKGGPPHERFQDDIMGQAHDGSIHMSNRMYGVDVAEENGKMKPEELILSDNGNAYYTNPAVTSNDGSFAFDNPLYASSEGQKSSVMEETRPEDESVPLPLQITKNEVPFNTRGTNA